MERHFHCTACGKCCQGWLPLTVKDALAHAGRFPLAVVWSPIKQGAKAFDVATRLGITVPLRKHKQVAVRIAPTSYMPPSFRCPALNDENLCGIHDDKPSRCRTMPFFPYRDEKDQADLLIPRPGWTCDTGATAPVVYRDKAIVGRDDFDRERAELLQQAPLLRAYAEWLLATVPGMADGIAKAALRAGGGHVIVSFASLLRRLPDVDKATVARDQIAVLSTFAARTAGQPALADYHRYYGDWIWELERVGGKRPAEAQ